MIAADPAASGSVLDLVGWVPAVVFPAATLLQFVAVAKGQGKGLASALSWGLFALANVCLYVFIGDWLRPQLVVATLGNAALQVVLVIVILRLHRPSPDKNSGPDSAPPRA